MWQLPVREPNRNIACDKLLYVFCVVFHLNVQTTSGDDVRDFAKQMKNKITRKYRHKPHKKSYLDYPTTREGGGMGE